MVSENRVGLAWSGENLNNDSLYSEKNCSNLIRESLISGGLGIKDSHAPLKDIIAPGMTVLLKPNWVNHENFSGKGIECLVTHPAFIEAVVKEVIKCNPKKIIIADAPIQGCVFDKLISNEWKADLINLSKCEIEILDLRRTILSGKDLNSGVNKEIRNINRYILFNLGKYSYLEPISKPEGRFRIMMYDPKFLNEKHKVGKHEYLLCKEAFEVDVVINLPKLKTHKKSGITGAIKNVVGLNGNKEYLPHHRVGGHFFNGDCYPDNSLIKRIGEFFLDKANNNINNNKFKRHKILSDYLIALSTFFGSSNEIEGSWFGNDTVWRMVLDLNKILLYGKIDGSLSNKQQRNIYSITDGIIAGEGEGPLSVTPVTLGIVSFSSSPFFADMVHSYLMGFDYRKIPLILESFNNILETYPLTFLKLNSCEIYLNQKNITLESLITEVGVNFVPPEHWKSHIEN